MIGSVIFQDMIIGSISCSAPDDGAWIVGDVELTEAGLALREFFEFLTAEDSKEKPDRVDIEFLMDAKNWRIVNSSTGEIKGIELPAIYPDDGSIYWRWRS
jgi:hypothetical protein